MNTLGRVSLAVAMVFALTACGGGSGSSETEPLAVIANPDTFYLADQDTDGVNELYQVDSSNPGISRKLNSSIVQGGQVSAFVVSPDSKRVVYLADQEVAGKAELFLVETADPGNSIKVSLDLAENDTIGFRRDFIIGRDSKRFFFTQDQDGDGQRDLFMRDLDSPAAAIQLNSNDVSGIGVSRFRLSSGNDFVVYQSQIPVNGSDQSELFKVDIANPGVSTRLTPTSDAFPNTAFNQHFISPNDEFIVYQADEAIASTPELFLIYLDMPEVRIRLNPPLPAGGGVRIFTLSADSRQVIYVADQVTAGTWDIFLVYPDAPGTAYKLNGSLPAGGQVENEFDVVTNNGPVVYLANQSQEDYVELYKASTVSPGASTKLNDAMPFPGTRFGPVYRFLLSADGETVVYLAEKETAGIQELYRVGLSNPGVITKLNGELPSGHSIGREFKFSNDGSRVVYRVSPGGSGPDQIFQSRLADPGTSVRLNGDLVSGGNVGGQFGFQFEISQ